MRVRLPSRALLLCLVAAASLCSAQSSTHASREEARDRAFLHRRGIGPAQTSHTANLDDGLRTRMAAARQQALRLRAAQARASSGPRTAVAQQARVAAQVVGGSTVTWQPLGPLQVNTAAYGLVTGRISSLVADPNDTSGNTVYVGATGGGVWKSTNAAGNMGSVTFTPLTDDLTAYSGSLAPPSLSIGAITVEPGNPEVVLAGTGDPNDALDSYYGMGLLRSTDGGTSWSLVSTSSDLNIGDQNYSFAGVGFAGFAWSTTTPGLVVAAVSQSLEGLLVNESFDATAMMGLYYSPDAGATWHLATITDGTNQIVQASNPPSGPPGNAATAVVWNGQRGMFVAAVRFHGYYGSTDGMTWTRLAQQPGSGLTNSACPANPGSTGSINCPIFRGALAVQPETGDTFALTTDANNMDRGLFRDVCSASGAAVSSCSSQSVTFADQITDTALDDPADPGYIDQADYNLSLAAVPLAQDTILLAGTEDVFRCSLANSCAWRNTTNVETCAAAQVAPSTHAIDGTFGANGLVYFGTDGGLWRTPDDVAQTGSVCASTDASHFQNLNGGLGSLGEIEHLAVSSTNNALVLAGMGELGVIASESAAAQSGAGAWQQLLTGEGSYVAMAPGNANNWLVSDGPGFSLFDCGAGGNCTASEFSQVLSRADIEDDADYFLNPAPWIFDPGNPANLLVGTCRVWRGPATGGWSAGDLVSDMLDGYQDSFCDGNAYLRSIAAGGSYNSSLGGERMYAGMAGPLDGGSVVPGHVFGATVPQAAGEVTWTDLWNSPVTNTATTQFNGSGYAVSSVAVDPGDSTGQTIYAGIGGFPQGTSGNLYRSTDGGAHWTNVTNSLPFGPVNAVVVDPSNSSYVYVAGDFGVFYTANAGGCGVPAQSCWSALGSGLPNAPVTDLKVAPGSGGNVLEAATYGRGVWTIGLATRAVAAQASLSPTVFGFTATAVGASSASSQAFTFRNTGSIALTITQITLAGDYVDTTNCGSSLAANTSCSITVTFKPTATGSRPGTLTVYSSAEQATLSAALEGTGLAPGTLTLTPTALVFPSTATGTNSQAMNIAARNTGGAQIIVTGITVAGADPNDFTTSGGNSCVGTIGVNATCTIPVVFNPLGTGTRTAELEVVAQASGSPFTASLTGSGTTAAILSVTPTSLAFASTPVNSTSAAQTLTLSNGGQAIAQLGSASASGDFLLRSSTCGSTLAPNASCTVSISFAPTATGSRTGYFTQVSSTSPNGEVQAPLSGTGLASGEATLSPASLAFGTVALGSSSSQSATFTNQGGASVTISAIGAGGDYTVTGGTCAAGSTLAVDSSCTVIVTFVPQASGSRSGTLTLSSNGTPPTLTTALSGSGAAPANVNAAQQSLEFGAVAVGAAVSLSVTLTNSGGVAATLGSPQVAGAGFSLANNGCGASLAANASCTVAVGFAPVSVGNFSGALTVSGEFNSSPLSIALSGAGVASALSFSPAPVSFGTVTDGQNTTVTVTVTNVTSNSVSLGTPTVPGGFSLSSACGSALAPGASCTIGVTFAPSSPGPYTGALTVPAANGAETDALSGTGIAAGQLGASPASIAFPATVVGESTASIQVTFHNTGGQPLTLGAPAVSSADYTIDSETCAGTLAAGSACTVNVAFTPATAGARSGTLTLPANGSSAQVALTGTGIAPASLLFTPGSASFGGAYLRTTSNAQTLTLSNPGGVSTTLGLPAVSGPFSITANTCGASLDAGASCTIAVQYAPVAAGAATGSLRVAGSSGTPAASAALSGTGWALAVLPASLAFTPPLTVGTTSQPLSVSIGNLGTTPLSLSASGITGDFAIAQSSCGASLPAQTTCVAFLTFTPTASGLRTGVYSVSDGVESHPVQLTGTGLSPATDTLSPTSLTFAATEDGTRSAQQAVNLTNSGDAMLASISVTVTGPFGAVNSCGASLGGHLACAIGVTFAPQATGAASGTLTVTDALRTQTVLLNGTGSAPPAPYVSPTSIDFGSYAVGVATPAQTVTVGNGGGAAMTNLSITAGAGPFSIVNSTCGSTLVPGATCSFGAVYDAPAPGGANGSIEITSPTLTAPLAVSLTGAGEQFQLAVVGASSDIVTPGQTAVYQFAVTPIGTSSGVVAISCSGAPAGATCSANPATVSVGNGTSSSVTVNVVTSGSMSAGLESPRLHCFGKALLLAITVPLWVRRKRPLKMAAALLLLLLLASQTACGVHASGANSGGSQTAGGTYPITVTATYPGAQTTATVSLVVQ